MRSQLAAIAIASAIGLVAYLVIRIPEARNWMLELNPHREHTATAVQRQMLAPRSVALASAIVLFVALVSLVSSRRRGALLQPCHLRDRLTSLLASLATVVAIASVLDVFFVYDRVFTKPLWQLDDDAVLSYFMPQGYPDSIELRRILPTNSRVAFSATSETGFYQLPALSYPIAFFEAPPGLDDGPNNANLLRIAETKKLTHILRYEPENRLQPFRVTPLAAR